MVKTSYQVDAQKRFERAVRSAHAAVGSLKTPLTLIANDFYKSQKAIFQLKGPGQYPDIKEATKAAKKRNKVPEYPILMGINTKGHSRGTLARSTLSKNDENAIFNLEETKVTIGTKVFYGRFHQFGTGTIPMRKFLFVGPEAAINAADPILSGRLERWTGILSQYVIAKLKLVGD